MPLAAAIGGIASLIGGRMANRAASAQAQRQMDFQERMSNTAHQREIKDLRLAGLNPILSATGGRGASSPGGAMAPIKDILTPAVSSALATRRLSQEIKNLEATEDQTKAQTNLTSNQSAAIAGLASGGSMLGEVGGTATNLIQALRSPQGSLWWSEFKKDISAIINRTGHSAASQLREIQRRYDESNLPGRVGIRRPDGRTIYSDR